MSGDHSEVNHGERPPYPSHETLLDRLRRNVEATPDATALLVPEGEFQDDGERLELSYAEMWAAIVAVAHELTRADARSGTRWVLVVLPQGLQQVIAVWGVMAAGCGYVPIDSHTQAARLRVLVGETTPSAAVGEAGETPLRAVSAERGVPMGCFPTGARGGLVVSGCGAAVAPAAPLPQPCVGDRALLLFSSGSTGTPKGIVYDHKWLFGGCWLIGRDLQLSAASRCLLRCSFVWSVSVYDLFPATLHGGVLVVPPPGGHMNVQYICQTVYAEGVDALVIQAKA